MDSFYRTVKQMFPQQDVDSRLDDQWSPDSWTQRRIAQPINYDNLNELNKALVHIRGLPDLISTDEIDALGQAIRRAANGEAFILQAGDCAEAFADVRTELVHSKWRTIQEQATRIAKATRMPVIPIGRIAGQYSKPRSNMLETLSNGKSISAFRGDNVNGMALKDRAPNPQRLLAGSYLAGATLSMLRMYDSSGHVFTSHEALHLPLETAWTRARYNTSAHMLWLGERTRTIDGAHVEYLRGIKNPLGIKLGPSTTAEELVSLLRILDPQREVGRVILITRIGAERVDQVLPCLIKAVQKAGHCPLWMCDPCHANTLTTATKIKTRTTSDMSAEIKATYNIHRRNGSHLGGLHLEQTSENVTECVDGGREGLESAEFPRYRSLCDPRLNLVQALAMADVFTQHVRASELPDNTVASEMPTAIHSQDTAEAAT